MDRYHEYLLLFWCTNVDYKLTNFYGLFSFFVLILGSDNSTHFVSQVPTFLIQKSHLLPKIPTSNPRYLKILCIGQLLESVLCISNWGQWIWS